eukprot:8914236-Pyramimonas_sp.AAC.1
MHYKEMCGRSNMPTSYAHETGIILGRGSKRGLLNGFDECALPNLKVNPAPGIGPRVRNSCLTLPRNWRECPPGKFNPLFHLLGPWKVRPRMRGSEAA